MSAAFQRMAIEKLLPNWFDSFGEPAAAAPRSSPRSGSSSSSTARRSAGRSTGSDRTSRGRASPTSRPGNPDKAPKAAESLQLGIYYLGVTLAPELERYRPVRAVDLAYLRGHWKTGELESKAWPISPTGEEEYQTRIRERLSELIARIRELEERGAYRPNPAAECYFCDFKPLCPLYPEGQPLFPFDDGVPA